MHLTHFIKQFVGAAVMPLACALLVVVIGAIVRLCGRRRAATVLWTVAALIVYLSAIDPVANALLTPLESRYPPLGDAREIPAAHFIVVLGSGYGPHDGIPITAALSGDGLARIAEGVRLKRMIPGARLVVSGGATGNQTTSAIGYARFAADFGVDPREIVSLDKSLDTAEEASSVYALTGTLPFILVTSAYHMPRAMRLMRSAGGHPIAAPTAQRTSSEPSFGARKWIPNSASLRKTECAIHEYMGLVIAK